MSSRTRSRFLRPVIGYRPRLAGLSSNGGKYMPPHPIVSLVPTLHSPGVLHRLLGSLSIFTMLMTIPQVLTIWVGHRAAGVSMLSWAAYLASAVVWLWYGIQ